MKKGFKEIEERDLIQKIAKIIPEDSTTITDITNISIAIRKANDNFNKPNYLRTKEEKKAFIEDVKKTDRFDTITEKKDLMIKMIDSGYTEFLLPYALSSENFDRYKNVEIIGIGYYDDNTELLS